MNYSRHLIKLLSQYLFISLFERIMIIILSFTISTNIGLLSILFVFLLVIYKKLLLDDMYNEKRINIDKGWKSE